MVKKQLSLLLVVTLLISLFPSYIFAEEMVEDPVLSFVVKDNWSGPPDIIPVELRIDEAQQIYGLQLSFTYDQNVLELVTKDGIATNRGELGDYFEEAIAEYQVLRNETIAETDSTRVDLAVSYLGRPQAELKTNGVIATYYFKWLNERAISHIELAEDLTKLMNADLEMVSGTLQGITLTQAEVNAIPDKSSVYVGQEFDVTIQLNNLVDLYGASVDFTYDPLLLEPIEIVVSEPNVLYPPNETDPQMVSEEIAPSPKGDGNNIWSYIRTRTGDIAGAGTVDEPTSGELVTFRFKAMSEGIVDLTVGSTDSDPIKVVLSSSGAAPIMFKGSANMIEINPLKPTDIVIDVPQSIDFNAPFGIGATLSSEGNPLPDLELIFSVDGSEVETILTDDNGRAVLSLNSSNFTPGDYEVEVVFDGNDSYQGSYENQMFTIPQESSILSFGQNSYSVAKVNTIVVPVMLQIPENQPISGLSETITYDATILQVNEVRFPSEGSFLDPIFFMDGITFDSETSGEIKINIVREKVDNEYTYPGSTDGIVFEIVFQSVAAGSSAIEHTDAILTAGTTQSSTLALDVVNANVSVSELIGDFNGDNDVNYWDLLIFTAAWGKTSQDPGWDVEDPTIDGSPFKRADIGPSISGEAPYYVIEPDEKVNYWDLLIFAEMWNWSKQNR